MGTKEIFSEKGRGKVRVPSIVREERLPLHSGSYTHGELKDIIAWFVEERSKTLGRYSGGVSEGLLDAGTAFRKTSVWAETYHNLRGIVPELAIQVGLYERPSDSRVPGFRISWIVILARMTEEKQREVYVASREYFDKSYEQGMLYIRAIVEGGVDPEELLIEGNPSAVELYLRAITSASNKYVGDMTPPEIRNMISSIPPRLIPLLRKKVKTIQEELRGISKLLEERR
jgi:hypothetical protein